MNQSHAYGNMYNVYPITLYKWVCCICMRAHMYLCDSLGVYAHWRVTEQIGPLDGNGQLSLQWNRQLFRSGYLY